MTTKVETEFKEYTTWRGERLQRLQAVINFEPSNSFSVNTLQRYRYPLMSICWLIIIIFIFYPVFSQAQDRSRPSLQVGVINGDLNLVECWMMLIGSTR